jgi:restriction system protein
MSTPPQPVPPSRSTALIGSMYRAALTALSQAPMGQMKKSALLQAMASSLDLDEWALEVYDTGHVRWQSIFAFASIGLSRGGYVTKNRGVWAITDQGREVLTKPYDGPAFLLEVRHKYQQWHDSQLSLLPKDKSATIVPNGELEFELVTQVPEGPQEGISRILKLANDALAAELIDEIKQCEPAFFEELVVRLLIAMGYGGNRRDAGRSVGKSGDGGVDGIINEDPLGLDTIYLQAKRWQNPVGEGDVRDFIGALDIKGVKKGVFLITSSFSPSAVHAVRTIRSDKKIVLIDGTRLAQLMIEHNLGVSISETFTLKRLDKDFFVED